MEQSVNTTFDLAIYKPIRDNARVNSIFVKHICIHYERAISRESKQIVHIILVNKFQTMKRSQIKR